MIDGQETVIQLVRRTVLEDTFFPHYRRSQFQRVILQPPGQFKFQVYFLFIEKVYSHEVNNVPCINMFLNK